MMRWTLAQQKVKISIPKGFSKEVREQIGEDIIKAIRDRALKENRGYDPGTGREFRFSAYTKKYAQFKGTSRGNVNLELSGDMFDAMKVLKKYSDAVTIGFDADDDTNNGKAEGNAKGTYGQKRPIVEGRPFLGLSQKRLKEILDKYETNGES